MAHEQILYGVADRIATVTLNRPDRLNAWTPVMEQEVSDAMWAAQGDPDVRAIVLTGAGRAFCAGADIQAIRSLKPGDFGRSKATPPPKGSGRPDFQHRFTYFPAITKPVIAMVNGPAAGVGLVQAVCCDLRFASADAVFTTSFSRLGLIAEHGIGWMLARIVGHANALDLLLSGRKIAAAEALAMGLVNRILAPDRLAEETYAYVRDLVDNVSPRSMRIIKRQQYEVPFQTLSEAIAVADAEAALSLGSDDFREGMARFVEKRAPAFTGR